MTGAREVASFTPLPDVSAGAVVATRSVVAGVIFLTKNPGVAVFALAEEGALQNATAHRFHVSNQGALTAKRREGEKLVKQ